MVHQERIYASIGQTVNLQCITESYPISNNYWLHGNDIITGGTYESITTESIYRVIMRYDVHINETKHFGSYQCIAKNRVGLTERTLHIHSDYPVLFDIRVFEYLIEMIKFLHYCR